MLVSKILQGKGTGVHTISPDETVSAVVARLSELGIGALVVSVNGHGVDGIISERDVVHGLAEKGAALLGEKVSSIMSRNIFTCELDDTGSDLLTHMTERRIRHVPVVMQRELRGMISIGDVVKSRLDEVTHETEAMREYIAHT